MSSRVSLVRHRHAFKFIVVLCVVLAIRLWTIAAFLRFGCFKQAKLATFGNVFRSSNRRFASRAAADGFEECSSGTCGAWEVESLSKDVKRAEQRALGIDINCDKVAVLVVDVASGGSLEAPSRVPLRSCENLTPVEFASVLSDSLVQALSPLGKWSGLVGCSVTSGILRALSSDTNDPRALIEPVLRKAGLLGMFHVMTPTEAAGYSELSATKSSSSRQGANWRKMVLVATLGENWGGVLFNDGHRIRRSGLDSLAAPDFGGTPCRHLPKSGEGEWTAYVDLADKYLLEMVELVQPDHVILLPTGEAALRPERLPASEFLPLMKKTAAAAASQGFTLASSESDLVENSVVRGAALSAMVEVRLLRARLTIRKAMDGASSVDQLSTAQLRSVYDAIDEDGSGSFSLAELERGLEAIGVPRDAKELFFEGMTFKDFSEWWQTHIASARVVTMTSFDALSELLQNSTSQVSDALGPLILAEVTFSFCRACKGFVRKYEQLAGKYKEIRFVSLVADHNRATFEMIKSMKIDKAPTFLLYQQGSSIHAPEASWQGASVPRCEKEIAKALALIDASGRVSAQI